jgi:hypothetical protein
VHNIKTGKPLQVEWNEIGACSSSPFGVQTLSKSSNAAMKDVLDVLTRLWKVCVCVCTQSTQCIRNIWSTQSCWQLQ